MFPSIRRALIGAVVAALSLLSFAIETANAYPDQPIKIIVTFPPGGSADIVIRALQPALAEDLRQPIIIENRAGAGGNIGIGVVAQAAPDGYTLGVAAAGVLTVNPHLNRAAMSFDPLKDLVPVTLLAEIPFVLVASQKSEISSVADLIAKAKAQPQNLSIGHGGNGTAMHLSAALFAQMADVKLVEVPYRGSGPAALDTMAGQIQLALVDLQASLQQIRAGKLIAFAVTSAQRVPMLPEVPSVAEAGLPGYDSTGWFGVVAPAGTPAPIVARLNAEINAALGDEQIKAAMRNLGAEPAPNSTEAFEAYIQSETKKWAKVIQTAHIRLD